jgi:hypothetical protein
VKSIVLPLRVRLCDIFDETLFSVGGRALYFVYFKAEMCRSILFEVQKK